MKTHVGSEPNDEVQLIVFITLILAGCLPQPEPSDYLRADELAQLRGLLQQHANGELLTDAETHEVRQMLADFRAGRGEISFTPYPSSEMLVPPQLLDEVGVFWLSSYPEGDNRDVDGLYSLEGLDESCWYSMLLIQARHSAAAGSLQLLALQTSDEQGALVSKQYVGISGNGDTTGGSLAYVWIENQYRSEFQLYHASYNQNNSATHSIGVGDLRQLGCIR